MLCILFSIWTFGLGICSATFHLPPTTTTPLPPTTTTTPDVTTPNIRTISATVGDTVTLPCVYTEAGPHPVLWYKKKHIIPLTIGKLLYGVDSRLTVHHDEWSDEWNLGIHNVNMADSGVYLCKLVSSKQNLTQTVQLTIVEKKESSLKQKELQLEEKVTALIGDQIFLPCDTTGTQYKKVIWWRKEFSESPLAVGPIIWTPDNRFYLNITNSHHNLVIHNVTTKDAGVYICQLVGKEYRPVKEFLIYAQVSLEEVTTAATVEGVTTAAAAEEKTTAAYAKAKTAYAETTASYVETTGAAVGGDNFTRPLATETCCPDSWTAYNGSCYIFHDEQKLDWNEANQYCKEKNSVLAEIETINENVFLKYYAQKIYKTNSPDRNHTMFWLGGMDLDMEGNWKWESNDQEFTFTDWNVAQPAHDMNNCEDCLGLNGAYDFQWNDEECEEKIGYPLCERKDPNHVSDNNN